MAKKEATPTQKRSAIVQAAIEKLYADAKKALATTWTETDPLKIAEAAQATEVSPETVKALTRQFWVAKIEELQAEVAVMQADLSEASRQWREALDEAVKKREAWERGHEFSQFAEVGPLVESYRAFVLADQRLPALQADLESRRAQRDAIYSSIEAAREELRKLTPKTMSMAPRIEIDVIGGRATVEPMR